MTNKILKITTLLLLTVCSHIGCFASGGYQTLERVTPDAKIIFEAEVTEFTKDRPPKKSWWKRLFSGKSGNNNIKTYHLKVTNTKSLKGAIPPGIKKLNFVVRPLAFGGQDGRPRGWRLSPASGKESKIKKGEKWIFFSYFDKPDVNGYFRIFRAEPIAEKTKLLKLLSVRTSNISTKHRVDLMPSKPSETPKTISWGKEKYGLRMGAWFNPAQQVIWWVITNVGTKPVKYSNYLLGDCESVHISYLNDSGKWQTLTRRKRNIFVKSAGASNSNIRVVAPKEIIMAVGMKTSDFQWPENSIGKVAVTVSQSPGYDGSKDTWTGTLSSGKIEIAVADLRQYHLASNKIQQFVAHPLSPYAHFKNFKVTLAGFKQILKQYYRISKEHWHNGYSHLGNNDISGYLVMKNGEKVKWLVKPGGLAWLEFADGKKIFLAKDLTPYPLNSKGINIPESCSDSEAGATPQKLQYRTAGDAGSPSRFIAVLPNGSQIPFLKINWKIGDSKQKSLRKFISQLEKQLINGKEFRIKAKWVRYGGELDVYDIEWDNSLSKIKNNKTGKKLQ